jgi:dTDP-4-dehydrorhamnose 3,5-epimerase
VASTFERTAIPDVLLISPRVHLDERGWFMESYKASEWTAFGVQASFIQDNHSRSSYGTIRGLHFQRPPKAQAKLVYVVQGAIFDVAVDIRAGSPTYGRWVGATLSAENHQKLYVPVGFAHGFCVMSETAEVLYKVTNDYSPEHEGGILWNDPDIAVAWPVSTPILSKKDCAYPCLKTIEPFFIGKEIR